MPVPAGLDVQLSANEARRMAVSAQGFQSATASAQPSARRVDGTIKQLGVLQIDSVNAVVRSHYLPLFSRLGTYERRHLDEAAEKRRAVFEYWGHQASFLPVALWPLMRWRMDHFRERFQRRAADPSSDGQTSRLLRERPEYIAAVLDEVRDHGPLAAADLTEPGTSSGPWWGWSPGKAALEYLLATGQLTVAHRTNFARRYDVPERVIPPEVLGAAVPTAADAQRELIARAAAALGVATARDLADYYELGMDDVRAQIGELVEDAQLVPATVEGWTETAYLSPHARCPTRVGATALISPFDSLMWDRVRTERIFGFRYRLEIYTPAEKRSYGYYVLPLMVGGRLVARIDVRANRASRTLEVPGAFAEPGCLTAKVADAARTELDRLHEWLDLDRVEVGDRGDLAPLIAR